MKKRLLVMIIIPVVIFLVVVAYWKVLPRNGVIDIPGEGIYSGQLRGHTFHGYGTYESYAVGGTAYEGEWRNGVFHGQGTLSFANGAQLQGEFVDGRITGWATSIDPDGHVHQYYFDQDGQLTESGCDHDH